MNYILHGCIAESLSFSLWNCNYWKSETGHKGSKIWAVRLKVDASKYGEEITVGSYRDNNNWLTNDNSQSILWILRNMFTSKVLFSLKSTNWSVKWSPMADKCCAEWLRCHSIWMHLIYPFFSCEIQLQDEVCVPFVIKFNFIFSL